MKVKLARDAFGHVEVAAIFLIAQDRIADDRHMRAELMLPPGDRLERDEGDALPCPVDHRVMGHRRLRDVLLAGPRLAHAIALGTCGLDQRRLDLALRRFGDALHQSPIDLAHRAGLEGPAELRRPRAPLGDNEHAGRVAIEPMYETRPR